MAKMISYAARAKKLMSPRTNNWRKMHGEPMMRWGHYIKLRDYKVKKADRISRGHV